jgi:hypothetical protein
VTSTVCAANGTLVGTPVAIDIILNTDSSINAVNATTRTSLSISSLLDKMWLERPPVLASFVSGITMPPMMVSYSSFPKRTFSLAPVAQQSDTPFSLLGNLVNVSAPSVTYQEDPTTLSMSLKATLPTLGTSPMSATVQVSATLPQLSMQVICYESYPVDCAALRCRPALTFFGALNLPGVWFY